MIYVDELAPSLTSARWPFKHACHLFADTVDELHHFAAAIGLQRSWFQPHPRLDHYDLTYGKRKLAVQKGAIEVNRQFVVDHFKPRVHGQPFPQT